MLQITIQILCTLASKGASKLTQIKQHVELDKERLTSYISFLYDRGLVGEQYLDEDENAFFITKRGESVLRVVGPLVKEAQRIEMRNFEAISGLLSRTKITSRIMKEKRKKWKLSDSIKIQIVETEEKDVQKAAQ
jgi:predicted transcriptional regulator